MALIKNHYGDGVMEDLLTALGDDLQFTKKFVLNEHHLYGSSRLGVKTQKRVLLRKEFSISGFEQDGTYIVDEVKDSLVYVQSEVYFCRMLGQKQYELTNHLGNVLATVLDRKTGVFDLTEDTLMYYEADVVNATLYYPFGMNMERYANIDFAYSFGMNTQEKDDEIYGKGNSYSAEYWQYDARLGRRWNVDPRDVPSFSPYSCFANNPIWFSDVYGDSATSDTPEGGQNVTAPDGSSHLVGDNFVQSPDKEYLISSTTNAIAKWDSDGGIYISTELSVKDYIRGYGLNLQGAKLKSEFVPLMRILNSSYAKGGGGSSGNGTKEPGYAPIEHLVGPALIGAGLDIVPKNSTLAKAIFPSSRVVLGASETTSIASLTLRRVSRGVGLSFIGGTAAKFVPGAGWGWTLFDATMWGLQNGDYNDFKSNTEFNNPGLIVGPKY